MVQLPRMGLGMAALGRPGYINLNRDSVFTVTSTITVGESDEASDVTRPINGAGTSTQTRTIDVMRRQANLVMDELFQLTKEATDKEAVSSSTTTSSTTTTKTMTSPMIPWIDCARSYGLSEQFVGDYLRTNNIPTDSVYVSSKWGYTYVADFNITLPDGIPHEVKDHSISNFRKQVQETNTALGEYIDLYQIHSATYESGILTDSTVHEALMSCKVENGWKIGLSVSGTKQSDIIRDSIRIMVNNERLFDSIQCTYNIMEHSPHDALQEAYDCGIDIIIKEGLANGRVLPCNNNNENNNNEMHRLLQYYSNELGYEPDQIALGCILAQPFCPRVLSGAVTPSQLSSNFKAMEFSKVVDKSIIDEIMKTCSVPSDMYWTERSALVWN